MKCNVSWKNIIVGFPTCDITQKIGTLTYIICIIAYSIFKVNSKFKGNDYSAVDIKYKVKQDLLWYNYVLLMQSMD